MDDRLLEKRLNKLKDEYEKMPSSTSADKVTNYVFTQEKKRCKKMRFSKLPSIVSSVAVILIACILGAQYILPQNDGQLSKEGSEVLSAKEEADQLTDKEKALIKEEINTHIDKKLEQLRSMTTLTNLEQIDYVDQVVQQVNENLYTIYEHGDMLYVGDKKTSKGIEKDAKAYLDYKLNIPAANLQAFEKNGAEWYESEEQLLDILEKQQQLSEILIVEWQEKNFRQQVSSIPQDKLIHRLNEPSTIENAQVRHFAEFVQKNGLVFVENGEGMLGIAINYKWMQKQLYDELSAQINDYFAIRQNLNVVSDGTLTISWDELADRIINLEDFMMRNPTFSKSPDLHQYYYQFLTYYLFGIDNSPVFDSNGKLLPEVKDSYERFMQMYDNQQTYYTIKGYYDILQKNQFVRSKESSSYVIGGLSQRVSIQSPKQSESEEKLLPLGDDLSSVYREFASSKDEAKLKGLSPLDVMRLYVHAEEINDIETKYALYMHGNNYYVPAKDEYMSSVNEVPSVDWKSINEQIDSIDTESIDEQTRVVKIILTEEQEPKYFRLLKNDQGIWKVSWLPMQ
ncbi:hypothetical protein LC040_14130 [Bacillus tianshenii]|nr:hypothetical protein LC040_14130 [Bacillus tianshenii]